MGKTGQFDVVVDGETVASRQGNILVRAFGGGWPDEAKVVDLLRQRAARTAR